MRLITAAAALAVIAIAGCNTGMDQQSATKVMTSALGGTAAAQMHFNKPTNGGTNASRITAQSKQTQEPNGPHSH